jgi:hypothetical protein
VKSAVMFPVVMLIASARLVIILAIWPVSR